MEDNYLDIEGLDRISFDGFTHPNSALKTRLKAVEAQTYILKGTIYGCWVTEEKGLTWFGFSRSEKEEGPVRVRSTLEFEELIERCEPEVIEPLLYHLDIFVKKDS